MKELLTLIVLALAPAVGTIVGALAAEATHTSRRRLSLALHLAAGLILGLIATEIAPRAFEGAPPWLAGLGFLAGGGFYVLLDTVNEHFGQPPEGSPEAAGGGWLVYAAVAVDLFSDGLLIGVGSSLSFGLAVVLAVAQLGADLPAGYAAIANFKDKGMPRAQRLLASASFILPGLAAALIAWFVLRGAPQDWRFAALAFTGGILLLASTEEIINEAHEATPHHHTGDIMIVVGFVLFALVDGYFAVH